jgi:hypothetical protein
MDNSSSQYFASLDARRRVCEHCASTFVAGRSDQRFCTDLCRLRRWRSRKTNPTACAANGQQRLDARNLPMHTIYRRQTQLIVAAAVVNAHAPC